MQPHHMKIAIIAAWLLGLGALAFGVNLRSISGWALLLALALPAASHSDAVVASTCTDNVPEDPRGTPIIAETLIALHGRSGGHWLLSSAAEHRGMGASLERPDMDPSEIQARTTIAAALIVARAVEIPTIPTSGDWSQDTPALRLRDLTDYVYQMIISPRPR